MKILNKQEVCEFLAIKPRCLEGMVAARKFPPPVRIGKSNYWSEESLLEWRKIFFMAQNSWRPGT